MTPGDPRALKGKHSLRYLTRLGLLAPGTGVFVPDDAKQEDGLSAFYQENEMEDLLRPAIGPRETKTRYKRP